MLDYQSRNRHFLNALVLSFLVFCEGFFFRNVLGNDALFGDRGDGRLTMLITEHWWQFISGKEGFFELPFVYP